MMHAKTIVLEYLCPAAGVLVANIMYTAPYRDVKRAAATGRLGDLSPTPWAFMFFNNLGWLAYAVLINNLFVFFGNVVPLVLAVWFNMIALELQYADYKFAEVRRNIVLVLQDTQREKLAGDAGPSTPLDYAKIVWDVAALNTKAPVAHKTIIMFLTIIWTSIFCVICLCRSFSPITKELIVGIAVNLNLVFFYAAPLSTIFTVVKTKSCASIHVWSMNTMLVNSLLWGVFGFAMVDWFIAIPNLLGVILGAVQIALCVIYPRTPTKHGPHAMLALKACTDSEQIEFYLCDSSTSEQVDYLMEGMLDVEKGNDEAATAHDGTVNGIFPDASVTTTQPDDSDKSSEQTEGSEDGMEDDRLCTDANTDLDSENSV